MELDAAGKELVRRLSVAAQRLDGSGGEPSEDMESLLVEAKAHLDPSTATGQILLDIIGIDIPSILVKFTIIPHDGACRGLAESILKTLAENCDARDMFTAYMEALHLYSEPETLTVCPLILDGLPIIFSRLRRRKVENIKESLPGLLRIAGLAVDTNRETWKILQKLVQIVTCFLDISAQEQAIERRKALHEAVGTFIMLLLVRFSEFENLNDSSAVQSLLLQLAELIPACGLSYLDAITGSFFKAFMDSMSKDLVDEDGAIVDVRQGSALSVWWIFCFGEKAAAVSQEVKRSVVDGVTSSRHAFLSALSNVSVLLSSRENPRKKVEAGIDLLAVILEWNTTPSVNSFHTERDVLELEEFLMLKELLQVVQNVVIFFPQSRTRQHAYNVLVNIIRKVLPPIERFQALKQLTTECEHSSMVSLLIYVAKEEVDKAMTSIRKGTTEHVNSPFVTEQVLELVDFVLRPPVGGPPDIPNQIDAVLSALNLYRFLLIKETTGKSNYTGVASHARLEEASSKWLLPLRAVLEGVKRDFSADSSSEVTAGVFLAISNLEGVLYRCLELAEAALKQHPS